MLNGEIAPALTNNQGAVGIVVAVLLDYVLRRLRNTTLEPH